MEKCLCKKILMIQLLAIQCFISILFHPAASAHIHEDSEFYDTSKEDDNLELQTKSKRVPQEAQKFKLLHEGNTKREKKSQKNILESNGNHLSNKKPEEEFASYRKVLKKFKTPTTAPISSSTKTQPTSSTSSSSKPTTTKFIEVLKHKKSQKNKLKCTESSEEEFLNYEYPQISAEAYCNCGKNRKRKMCRNNKVTHLDNVFEEQMVPHTTSAPILRHPIEWPAPTIIPIIHSYSPPSHTWSHPFTTARKPYYYPYPVFPFYPSIPYFPPWWALNRSETTKTVTTTSQLRTTPITTTSSSTTMTTTPTTTTTTTTPSTTTTTTTIPVSSSEEPTAVTTSAIMSSFSKISPDTLEQNFNKTEASGFRNKRRNIKENQKKKKKKRVQEYLLIPNNEYNELRFL